MQKDYKSHNGDSDISYQIYNKTSIWTEHELQAVFQKKTRLNDKIKNILLEIKREIILWRQRNYVLTDYLRHTADLQENCKLHCIHAYLHIYLCVMFTYTECNIIDQPYRNHSRYPEVEWGGEGVSPLLLFVKSFLTEIQARGFRQNFGKNSKIKSFFMCR